MQDRDVRPARHRVNERSVLGGVAGGVSRLDHESGTGSGVERGAEGPHRPERVLALEPGS